MDALFATFGIDAKLLLIQAVNFGLTMGVLWWFLFRPLIKVIDERKAKVAKGVADAEEAAKSRSRIESERSGIIAVATKNAEDIVTRATEQGKTERNDIVRAAQERAEESLRGAEAQAAELRRQALKESEKEIARTAVLAAEKLLQKS